MESLPLLHQAPSPEQQPASQQSKDLAPGLQTELSKPDLSKASTGAVDSAGGHADNLHAAEAKADTLGMSQETVCSLQQLEKAPFYWVLHCFVPNKFLLCHAGQQGLQLSEGAISYGLLMLDRSGGAMRQHITTENMYEQRLLPEVVRDVTFHVQLPAALIAQTAFTQHVCWCGC